MLSPQFLNSFLKKIDKVETNQLKTMFKQLKHDYVGFYTILNVLPGNIFALDADGCILFCNECAKKTFYIHPSHMHKHISQIISIQDFALVFHRWLQTADIALREELISETPFQSVWDIELYNMMLERSFLDKEHDIAYLIVIQDITTAKKLQERVSIQKNLISMQHLAASLAHEIKNPLTSIKLYITLLKRFMGELDLKKESSQNMQHALSTIEQEVERLSDITSNFLTNIRPLSLNIKKLNIETILSSVKELIQPTLTEQSIYLTLQIEENLPPLAGDNKYIHMVVLNLLKNAIESFEEKVNRSNKKEILVKVEENAPFIQLIVQDNGMGIPKENLGKIFDPYFTSKKTGTGLGLSLVQKIVTEHKGDISMESRFKKGTTVSILLPMYKGVVRKFLGKKS